MFSVFDFFSEILVKYFLHSEKDIADVTAFLKFGSLLDVEAKSRATSVYLADRKIDMLPTVLSESMRKEGRGRRDGRKEGGRREEGGGRREEGGRRKKGGGRT
jgi:hypothetical protein